MYKQITKTCTDSLKLKKTTHHHKNGQQHKHGQYRSRVNEYLKRLLANTQQQI